MAAFQEKGRGACPDARGFPSGESLLATVVLRVGELVFPLNELPLRAGIAVARAVEISAEIPVTIKWPNYSWWVVESSAGPLCEVHGPVALVGFGVNCTQSAFPAEIARTAC